ncbi:MAG: DUF885 domain-containing protein [Balneolaceae bacterium]
MSHLRLILHTLVLILFIASCSPAVQQAVTPAEPAAAEAVESESDRLNRWLDETYEEYLQMSPVQLTMLGRKDQYDKIDDYSEEAEERELQWRAETVQEMEELFDYEKLDPEAKLSWDLWAYQYEVAKAGAEFMRHHYQFEQMWSRHTVLPNFLINMHRVDEASDVEAYISRIEGISRALHQMIERSRLQAEEGIRPPKFALETVITQSRALISGVPFEGEGDSPLLADIDAKIDSLHSSGTISESEADAFRASAVEALLTHFQPAYQELITWIESELKKAEEKPTGVSRHTNGDAFYNYMLRYYTTTDLTADEIHNIGLAEVERIHEQMHEIIEEVGFEGSLQDFFEFISTDEQFFYPNTDEGREAYLEDSRRFLDGITEQLPEYFGILPKADLVVRRVEAFREVDGAPQHYQPGTPDGSRPGTYYAHLSDMSSMPKSVMEAIAYHEGNPGHHMQISIAQELESVPQFRTQERSTVYTEGWALYAEKLAREMGGYENPYSEFGRLVSEIWRAIRLVVDTGLHAKGWTEEDAFNYMNENSSIAEGAIRAEVRRYMVIPGQATAYKIGMIKIEELRAHAEEQLGNRFDIRAFHDTILGSGSLPLHLLEQEVNRWIESQLAS